jgi:hypothetical protein
MKLQVASLLFTAGAVQSAPASQAARRELNPPGPPGASGSLRGTESLLGFDSSNSVPKTPSTVIPPSDFELAPGQSEDADLGLYLDLTNVKNPQSIRGGTTGPTDPGPR